jgi:sterol desaturase/sphingolipid hydroxylase (fatty acid hydroxylase superfamily)
MELIHHIFDWKGIPVLIITFWMLFFIESRLELRKRVQNKWQRSIINNMIAIPSFLLLRFMFLPAMIWITLQNEVLRFGLDYLVPLNYWIKFIITFLVFDYANYLWHLLNHKVPMLWRFHLVHHTDPDLDLTTAIRFHFGEMIGSLFFRGTFVFLSGASPLMVLIYEIIFEAEVLFHHSNIKIPLKLERLLNVLIVTPRMHGIHHSVEQEETNSNFASVFSFWDRLHSTDRLSLTNDDIEIGVPSYHRKEELTIVYLLLLPFKRIRKWNETVN